MIYFAPLITLFPKNFSFYRNLFQAFIIFGVAYLLLDVFFIKNLLYSGDNKISQGIVENLTELSLPIGFILLTYVYHPAKTNLFAIGIIIVTLLFAIIRARRGLVFITFNIILFSYLTYFLGSKRKVLILYFSVLTIILGIFYASNIYNISNNKLLGYLANRSTADTRTVVELYFYDDMKTIDWIAGRSIQGQYFCPDLEEDQATDYRSVIETGYLQIILKGGIISLGLLLLIMLPALIKGIFFSRNHLSKAAGIWIFLFLINLYPQNAVAFNFSYLLVWISVGICFSKNIRKMSDKEIRENLYLQ